MKLLVTGEKSDQDHMILDNLKYVKWMANRYKRASIPYEDLFQEGVLGLLRARKTFDVNKGVKFITYAIHFIKFFILEYISKNNIRFETYNEDLHYKESNIEHEVDNLIKLDFAVKQLDLVQPRNKDILISRRIYEVPYKELANKYGVSMERIRQLEVGTAKKLTKDKK